MQRTLFLKCQTNPVTEYRCNFYRIYPDYFSNNYSISQFVKSLKFQSVHINVGLGKYLLHISTGASIYITERPSCHVLSEKYRRVTDAGSTRCSARKSKLLTENQDGRGERSEANQDEIDDEDEDHDHVDGRWEGGGGGRRRENAAIVPCSRHSQNRTVRRRSQIDTTGKSTVERFFRK